MDSTVRLDYATRTLKGGEGLMWPRGDGERVGGLRVWRRMLSGRPGVHTTQEGQGRLSAPGKAGGALDKKEWRWGMARVLLSMTGAWREVSQWRGLADRPRIAFLQFMKCSGKEGEEARKGTRRMT